MTSRAYTAERCAATSELEVLTDNANEARAEGRPLPSPCVKLCRIDQRTGWCEGCFRRLEEIGGWRSMSEEDKWAIWLRIPQRRNKE